MSRREEIYEEEAALFKKTYDPSGSYELSFNDKAFREAVYNHLKKDEEVPIAKEEFSTGAVRDVQEGKIQYSLIPYQAQDRLGKVLTDGAIRYGKDNFKKGMPYTRVIDSLMRHVEAIRRGKDDEDHIGCAMANLAFLAYYEDMISKGKLPKELDDRDKN